MRLLLGMIVQIDTAVGGDQAAAQPRQGPLVDAGCRPRDELDR